MFSAKAFSIKTLAVQGFAELMGGGKTSALGQLNKLNNSPAGQEVKTAYIASNAEITLSMVETLVKFTQGSKVFHSVCLLLASSVAMPARGLATLVRGLAAVATRSAAIAGGLAAVATLPAAIARSLAVIATLPAIIVRSLAVIATRSATVATRLAAVATLPFINEYQVDTFLNIQISSLNPQSR